MGFFNFLKKESVEDRALSLEEGIVEASTGIYEGILAPNLKYDSSSKYSLFLEEGTTYTKTNATFALFEIALYVYFRVDYEMCSVKDSLTLREILSDLCFQDIFSLVEADEQVRAKQIDIRLSRYAKTANALKKGNCRGVEFSEIMNELSLSFVKRAANANGVSQWQIHEKTVFHSLGLIGSMMIKPELPRMERKYIGPLISKARKKCQGL